MKWLRHGDSNSRFFHATVQQRRVQGAIHQVRNMQGDWVEDDEGIANVAISYFSNLFSGSEGADLEMLQLIPNLITREDNVCDSPTSP